MRIRIGNNQLGRLQPGQGSGQNVFFTLAAENKYLSEKFAGGDINPGQSEIIRNFGRRQQKVIAFGVKQRFFGQGSGGYQADNLTLNYRLAAAFFGFFGIFGLLADGNFIALTYQLGKVAFIGMKRHTAHRNVFTLNFAAFGQGNIQRFGCFERVIQKQLVKIAHPVEQQIVRILPLNLNILGHHRRQRRQFVKIKVRFHIVAS